MEKIRSEARRASHEIAKLSVLERTQILHRLMDLILGERERIIDAIQKDTRKSRSDALMSEIFTTLDVLEYLIQRAPKVLADRKVPTPLALMGKTSKIFHEPIGTVLVISPWNYPFFQCVGPCAFSFSAGNATIYNPSEHTPLKGLCEDLFSRAGFASGWIQIIYGDGKIGSELIETRPEKIFFTGSVRTGKKIMEQAARHLIPLELELGGKDPMIVFEDVNLDRAAAGAVWGAFTNTGQSCTSVERVYVQESVADAFRARVIRLTAQIRQGTDSNGDGEIGPMTVPFQASTVREHLKEAGVEGVGQGIELPPVVVPEATSDMRVIQEETFGPVLPIMTFKTEEDAIRMANDSEYGLTASVWSADLKRAERVARALQVGGVSINNVMITEGNPHLPFGGVKNSGIGRFKGDMGLIAFTNVKSIVVDKNSSKIEANWYPYTQEKYRLFTEMMLGLFKGGLMGLIRFAIAGLKLESYSQKSGKALFKKSG